MHSRGETIKKEVHRVAGESIGDLQHRLSRPVRGRIGVAGIVMGVGLCSTDRTESGKRRTADAKSCRTNRRRRSFSADFMGDATRRRSTASSATPDR
jgi:hypothetical protein